MAIGFIDQHEVFLRAQRHAIGEIKIVEQHVERTAFRVKHHQPTRWAKGEDFQNIMAIFKQRRGIGEINLAVFGNRQIIDKFHPQPIMMRRQRGNLTIGGHGNQPLFGIGNHQIACGVKFQTQRTPARIGQNLFVTIGGEANNIAIGEAAIKPTLRVKGHCLRAGAGCQHVGRRQLIVFDEYARACRIGRARWAGHRIKRHRPQ